MKSHLTHPTFFYRNTPMAITRKTIELRTAKEATLNWITYDLFAMAEPEYIDRVISGVKAVWLVDLATHLHTPRKHLLLHLNLPNTTIERKIAKGEALGPQESERIAGLKRLIDQVQTMVEESGEPPADFDAAAWLGQWLDTPLPALAGKKPAHYLSTVTGQNMLSRLLAQMQSGAYA
jgi:putative toxin-antitoxin system antitoxin component (TIGR02293 family)